MATLRSIHTTTHWSGTTLNDTPIQASAEASDRPPIPLSAAPAHGGEADRWNPNALFGAALSSCQMIGFLSVAQKARLDVREYIGRVELIFTTEQRRTRIQAAILTPQIRLGPDADPKRAHKLFETAHRYCIVANSMSADIVLKPDIQ